MKNISKITAVFLSILLCFTMVLPIVFASEVLPDVNRVENSDISAISNTVDSALPLEDGVSDVNNQPIEGVDDTPQNSPEPTPDIPQESPTRISIATVPQGYELGDTLDETMLNAEGGTFEHTIDANLGYVLVPVLLQVQNPAENSVATITLSENASLVGPNSETGSVWENTQQTFVSGQIESAKMVWVKATESFTMSYTYNDTTSKSITVNITAPPMMMFSSAAPQEPRYMITAVNKVEGEWLLTFMGDSNAYCLDKGLDGQPTTACYWTYSGVTGSSIEDAIAAGCTTQLEIAYYVWAHGAGGSGNGYIYLPSNPAFQRVLTTYAPEGVSAPPTCDVTVKKVDSESGFEITANMNGTNTAAKVRIESDFGMNEIVNLPITLTTPGAYTVTEVTPAVFNNSFLGYYNDGASISFTAVPDEVATHTIANTRQKGQITVQKLDEETGAAPQGSATLSGAWFVVRARENITLADGNLSQQELFSYTIDGDITQGTASVNVQSLGVGSATLGSIVAIGQTDENGIFTTPASLDLGKYEVQEIVPSNGYQFFDYAYNSHIVNVDLTYAGENVAVTTKSIDYANSVIKGHISIQKMQEASDEVMPSVGVQFAIYHGENENGEHVMTLQTNEFGYASTRESSTIAWAKDEITGATPLPFGTYTVVELNPNEGYEAVYSTVHIGYESWVDNSDGGYLGKNRRPENGLNDAQPPQIVQNGLWGIDHDLHGQNSSDSVLNKPVTDKPVHQRLQVVKVDTESNPTITNAQAIAQYEAALENWRLEIAALKDTGNYDKAVTDGTLPKQPQLADFTTSGVTSAENLSGMTNYTDSELKAMGYTPSSNTSFLLWAWDSNEKIQDSKNIGDTAYGYWVVQQVGLDMTGTPQNPWQTDENSVLDFAHPLPYGDYTLVEVKAPYGLTIGNAPNSAVRDIIHWLSGLFGDVDDFNADSMSTLTAEQIAEYGQLYAQYEQDFAKWQVDMQSWYAELALLANNTDERAYTDLYANRPVMPNPPLRIYHGTAGNPTIDVDAIKNSDIYKQNPELFTWLDDFVPTSNTTNFSIESTGKLYPLLEETQGDSENDGGQLNSSYEYNKIVTMFIVNEHAKGYVELTKTGLQLTGTAEKTETHNGKEYTLTQPTWKVLGLADAKYEITATSDIVTADGKLHHQKGDIVATLTTNENGVAISEPLYIGAYELKEIKAPYGYILDETAYPFEITYKGQSISIYPERQYFYNIRQNIEVEIEKMLEVAGEGLNATNTAHSTAINANDVWFGLYANEEIYDRNGKLAFSKDDLIEVIEIKDAKGVSTLDLPLGMYYMQELDNADDAYILSGFKYEFEFVYTQDESGTGKGETVLKLKINEGVEIVNMLKRGYISLFKYDGDFSLGVPSELITSEIDGEPLSEFVDGKVITTTAYENGDVLIETKSPYEVGTHVIAKLALKNGDAHDFEYYTLEGAVFGAYDESGALVATATTDETGNAILGENSTALKDGLPYGIYTIKELTPPSGYRITDPSDEWVVQIKANDEIVTTDVLGYALKIPNTIDKPIARLYKYSTSGETLANAEFTLYKMTNEKEYKNYLSILEKYGDVVSEVSPIWCEYTGENGDDYPVYTTDEKGELETGYLEDGIYKLVETKNPSGFTGTFSEVFIVNAETMERPRILSFTAYNAPNETPIEEPKVFPQTGN